jgi:hypothetical protein
MPRPDLAAVVDGLGIPNPERARILEEIASDLEEMRGELIRRGMDPLDADAEALRLLAPSELAVAALASVHEPLYASLDRRFSSRLRLAEWTGLVAVTLTAIGMALGSLMVAGVLRSPSAILLPQAVVAVAVFALAGRKTIQLQLARDHAAERLHAGMAPILVGSGLALLLGFGGAAYELRRLAVRLEMQPERTAELVVPWLFDTAVLMGAGLATALVGGLAWFLLQQKISAVEGADLRAAAALERATSTPRT